MRLSDMNIRKFVEEVSSSSPAPGGGSVAALSGALSAALSSMVCNLTIGKEKYKDIEDKMEEILSRAKDIMHRLLDMIDEDTEAFNRVIEAIKLPKGTEEERKIRKEKLQESLKKASLVPLETSRLCAEIIQIAKEVAEKGNKNSITDAGVSGLLAYAGLKSAILNVKINLGSIEDENFVESLNYEMDILLKNAESAMNDLEEVIFSYI